MTNEQKARIEALAEDMDRAQKEAATQNVGLLVRLIKELPPPRTQPLQDELRLMVGRMGEAFAATLQGREFNGLTPRQLTPDEVAWGAQVLGALGNYVLNLPPPVSSGPAPWVVPGPEIAA